MIDKCDNATGCVHTSIDCNDNNLCTDDICDLINGCLNVPKRCYTNISCKVTFCNATDGTCGTRDVPCTHEDFGPVIVTSFGSGAAIALIIAGIIIGLAAVGGIVYAIVKSQKGNTNTGVTSQPLYKKIENSGDAPY